MPKVPEQVEAEFENIERVLTEMPNCESLLGLSPLELAGVAALVHNFYNGIENILKLVITSYSRKLPDSSSWHRDLIDLASSNNVISKSTAKKLQQYLAFRHFFSHGYSFDLDKNRIIPLVRNIQKTFASFRNDVNNSLKKI